MPATQQVLYCFVSIYYLSIPKMQTQYLFFRDARGMVMNIEEELLRKILEKLESIDESLESISDRLNKPLLVISPETRIKKPLENTQTVVITPKNE